MRKRALGKEMTKVKVAWKIADDTTPDQVRAGKAPNLIGYQEIKCHVVFDVRMDFRKARFVAGGHLTETPGLLINYSNVMSCDSIRIAFLIVLTTWKCSLAISPTLT